MFHRLIEAVYNVSSTHTTLVNTMFKLIAKYTISTPKWLISKYNFPSSTPLNIHQSITGKNLQPTGLRVSLKDWNNNNNNNEGNDQKSSEFEKDFRKKTLLSTIFGQFTTTFKVDQPIRGKIRQTQDNTLFSTLRRAEQGKKKQDSLLLFIGFLTLTHGLESKPRERFKKEYKNHHGLLCRFYPQTKKKERKIEERETEKTLWS